MSKIIEIKKTTAPVAEVEDERDNDEFDPTWLPMNPLVDRLSELRVNFV